MKVCWGVVLILAMLTSSLGWGQQATVPPSAAMAGQKPGTMMLTIFLRHDQSKSLDQINAQAKANGFDRVFPPAGVEVVSWYVMMGIGQVVTLRFPAEKLREVNLAIEHGAWGAYRTDFYATYDYKPVWEAEQKKMQEGK
jgi:hypothetical protein